MKVNNTKRIWAFVLSSLLCIEQVAFSPHLTSKADNSAKSSESELFPADSVDAAQLIHDDRLVDNNDGTFTFTSKISSEYSYSDTSTSRLKSKDDYYTFKKPGKYLIELWGGDGGDGGRAFLSGRNGVGGQGGFVYGVLTVAADEVEGAPNEKKLFYEIGSKGESKTFDVSGGGTGGDGGGAGDITFISVGAGGGYSAVYLVDADDTTFTTQDKNDPSVDGETKSRDSTDKVLMIAGGGGGGAAGANGFHLTALILKMHGDGGDGGTKSSSISATPSIGNFTSGTYYAGEDGTSSSSKTSYVGKGGTDKPQGLAKTTIGLMTASTYANDWQMTYHPELNRGVGGAGNLHGGGGGAGFAGGGGGIQNVFLDANSVGGGGGGSSYVKEATSNFEPFDTNIPEDYFVPQDVERENGGGAVVITYLENNDYYDYLSSVTISGKVSQYFDIQSATYSQSGRTPYTISPTSENVISFSGSIAPQSSGLNIGHPKETLTLTLRLKPKPDFIGGNDVPIFDVNSDNMAFTCSSNEASPKTCTLINVTDSTEKDISHVNVPYSLNFTVNSLIKGIGEEYDSNDLINKRIDPDNSDHMQDFISDITYSVYEANETTEFSSYTVLDSDAGTTRTYNVRAELTPNSNSPAKVGRQDINSNNVISRNTIVKFVEEAPLNVDGFSVTAKKNLSYDVNDDTYALDLDLNITHNDYSSIIHDTHYLLAMTQGTALKNTYKSASATYNINVTSDGWYYIQAWGGNGGKGYSSSGGAGGTGGYISGFVFARKGQRIYQHIGNYGSSGNDNYKNGKGGKYTAIYLLESTDDATDTNILNDSDKILMIAGGGAGGNSSGTAGSSGSIGTYETTFLGLDNYNGHDSLTSGNTSQEAGPNYLNESLVNLESVTFINTFNDEIIIERPALDTSNSSSWSFSNSDRNVNYGVAALTRLTKTEDMTGELASLKKRLSDFIVSEEYSKYFDVQDILIDGESINSADSENIPVSILDYISYTDPDPGYSNNTTTYYQKADISAYNSTTPINRKVTVKLKRKTGFIGGNDVPLLDEAINAQYDKVSQADIAAVKITHNNLTESIDDDVKGVPPDELTDYANVEIDSSGVGWLNRIDANTTEQLQTDYTVPYGGDLSTYIAPDTIDITDDEPSTWHDDYVNRLTQTITPPLDTQVTEDTSYILKATLAPKYPDDTDHTSLNAVVREQMSAKDTNIMINVHVQYSISASDTGIDIDKNGFKFTKDDIRENDLVIKITPKSGYNFPLSATDDTMFDIDSIISDVSGITGFNAETMLSSSVADNCIYLTIPKNNITGNIGITGTANPDTNTVYYLYEVYDPIDSTEPIKTVKKKVGDYLVGQEIPASDISLPFDPDYSTSPALFPKGYESYLWSWGDGEKYDGNQTRTMGDSDMYLLGRYLEKTYTLTINYIKYGESKPFRVYSSPQYTRFNESTGVYEMALKAGSQYYVISPQMDGYAIDKPVIAGTVGDSDPEPETVTYLRTLNNFILYQIECDAYGVPTGVFSRADSMNIDMNANEILYYTQFKKITPEAPAEPYYVEEEVDSIGATGVYYVYYRAKLKRVSVHFNEVQNGVPDQPYAGDVTIGIKAGQNNTVSLAAGREFSYDPDTDTYKGMPRAVCNNYIFDGWYDSSGKLIKEDDIIPDTDETIELYAHWKSDQVIISVDYRYAYNAVPVGGFEAGDLINENDITSDPQNNQVTRSVTYGMSYSIASPTVNGYNVVNETQKLLKGVAFENEHFNVYYKNSPDTSGKVTYTINVYSSAFKGEDNQPDANAPKVTGGTLTININGTNYKIENIDGTITLNNTEYPIKANTSYEFVFTPKGGYQALNGTITVSNEGVHNIFLDKSKFQLPMAGTTPLTGYTVFGSFTMVIAGLLLFIYIRRRSEEDN